MSVFDPKFPGAFPFRLRESTLQRLSELLCGAGATTKDETLHLEGSLLVGA